MKKYSQKFWRVWFQYAQTLPRDLQGWFYLACVNYGAQCKEPDPERLPPHVIEYFNAKVRPEYDRQHRKQDRERARQRTDERNNISDQFKLLEIARKGGNNGTTKKASNKHR